MYKSEKQLMRKGSFPVVNDRYKNGVRFLTFPSLEKQEWILHGFSTREGGVSERELSAMNLSFSRGDDPENVKENYRRIASAIGFDPASLVVSHQTHTTNIREVTEKDKGKGYMRPRDYTDIDGLITNVPGIVLATFYADCVPLYFADPVCRAIGLSHSGWKGTVNNIAAATVAGMNRAYGCAPENIVAAIGPSICQDCYEVSGDVIEQFCSNYEKKDWDQLFYRKANGKYQLNLWEACRINLLRAGILPENIETTDVCTCCNPEILFSHRASRGKRGNLAAFLSIR